MNIVTSEIAERVAEVIYLEEFVRLLDRVVKEQKDWKQRSKINPCMTKGKVWNILLGSYDQVKRTPEGVPYYLPSNTCLKNIIWEFGEYLEEGVLRRAFVIDDDAYHEVPNLKLWRTVK